MNGEVLAVGLIAAAALLLIWVVITYNRFVRLRRHIQESWADIDVELKRRYELIPNLVATVKGYAEYERETIERVVELRGKAMDSKGSAVSQALDESALMIGLKQMFAVVEGYPQLKANTHFLALQKELANTEDRIAAARRFYNGNVRDINVLLESFPAGVIGRRFGFEPATFFELAGEAERVVPRVNLLG
jgi:LemA protein